MSVIYGTFLATAAKDPAAVAIVDEHGPISYGELAQMASAIEAQLPEDSNFIGIIMDHGAEMIASMLAVLKHGAAYVPAEPDFPSERIAFMLHECQAEAVITQEKYAELAGSVPEVVIVEPRGSESSASVLADFEAKTQALEEALGDSGNATPEGLAYVLYTSGTTGTPKGVSVENSNVCSYVAAFKNEFHTSPGERMLQHSVCSFDIFAEEVFSTLLSGATLMIPPKAIRDDTARLIDYLDQHEVTSVDGFPYLLDDINAREKRPSTVRLYISGGDVLHASQVSNLVNEAMVYNTYGPSETTCCVSYFRCGDASAGEDGTYPIGRPILGSRIDVVDDDMNPVAHGEVGEFLITGPGVSRGYLGVHPEQANFVVDDDGTRRYRSGDMGYVDANGDLVFLHRKDDQVMIKGKRVEAKEVENVLLQDPDVHQAVVVPGRDDGGFSFLVAYVVLADDAIDFSLSELQKRISRHLTPFMIPEFFIKMDSIPLNTHGKPAVEELPVVLKAAS